MFGISGLLYVDEITESSSLHLRICNPYSLLNMKYFLMSNWEVKDTSLPIS